MVKEKFDNVYFVEGTSRELLEKVRDLVHSGSELITHPLGASLRMMFSGSELITHPLGASLRMMFSPCFTVVVKEKQGKLNNFHAEIIESSIEKYDQHMGVGVREEDVKNSKDYAIVDYKLLESALGEINNNAMSF
jgi:hypothetical protein